MNPTGAPPASANITITIAEVLKGIWQRKLMILLLTLLALGGALFFVMTAKALYTTEAKVLIDNLETPFERIQPSDGAQRREFTDSDILSQLAVLTSNDLAERVITSLKLTERKEFDPLSQGVGLVSRWLIKLGFKGDPRNMTPEQRAMKRYADMLTVYQVPDSKVIVISYESNDPATAAEVANTLAEIYVTSTREAQSEPTGRARDWLSDQIESLRQKVVESERAAEEFRATAGLLKGREGTLSNEALSELNQQIILASAQRAEAETKAKAIREALSTKGNVDSSSDVLASGLIQRLREQQVALRRQASELAVTYLPNHPKMVAIRSEIGDVDRQIRAEALKIVQGLENEAEIAQSREAALRTSLNEAKATASEANLDDVKLRELEREAAANREILEALLNRYTDANSRNSLEAQPGFARIIQSAMVPSSPSFPRTGPTIVLATIGGLAFGLGLAFLLSIMSAASAATSMPQPQAAPVPAPRAVPEEPPPPPRLVITSEPEAVPQQFEPTIASLPPAWQPLRAAPAAPSAEAKPPQLLPALCEVPATGEAETAIVRAFEVISNPNTPYASGLVQVASWLASVRQTLGISSLAVGTVSDGLYESSTAAMALARSLARHSQRVIVVDAARDGRQLDPVAGLSPGAGLAEILMGNSKFAEVITSDGASSVHILRAGYGIDSAAAFFSTNRMDAILRSLEQNYDVLILSLGHIDRQAQGLGRFTQAGLILADPARADEVGAIAADWRHAGLRAVQFVRLAAASAVGGKRTPVKA